jgi:polyribonucleotide nucleotidyltransferase
LERENAVTAIKEEAKAARIQKLGESGFCQISLNILTDIIGTEDHFEEMDFKLSGTINDLKIQGLSSEIAKEAIMQNKNARMQNLDIIESVISGPRKSLQPNAPKLHGMQIDPDKIGALVGPAGKNIKQRTEITGAQIDIKEDNNGKVVVLALNEEALEWAKKKIGLVCCEIEQSQVSHRKVTAIKEFGVFVECLPRNEGLVHVSEMVYFRAENPADLCKIGDDIMVKCIGVDEKDCVRLSRKAVICEAKRIPYETTMPRSSGGGDKWHSFNRNQGGRSFGGDRASKFRF